ncbi:MAG: ArsI/CadI family heavy metal resistance metalloenzyme [Candidatus Binatia bacterium]
MSRIQLALNVGDLDEAVAFYGRLFGAEPAKRRPGYANFAIADPPLKLVLIAGVGEPGTLNHLGVEVPSSGDVASEASRLGQAGFELRHEQGVSCCYAVQDKFWVAGVDRREWEIYTVLGDAPNLAPQASGNGNACCASQASSCAAESDGAAVTR